MPIELQQKDGFDDWKRKSYKKEKHESGDEAEGRDGGMASIAMTVIAMVVLIIVQASTVSPISHRRVAFKRGVKSGRTSACSNYSNVPGP
jgi:hypothetical protein